MSGLVHTAQKLSPPLAKQYAKSSTPEHFEKNSSDYFSTAKQTIRESQSSIGNSNLFNAMDYGPIIEHVAMFIISQNGQPNDLNLIQKGINNFLEINKGDSRYDELRVNSQKSHSSHEIVTNRLVVKSPVKTLQEAPTHWQTANTSGHSNNCGIFAMFPNISPEKAQAKRNNLLVQLTVKYKLNSFSDVDYVSMQMNLPEGVARETMTRAEIFTLYIKHIARGDFLDPFALQKIADIDGKYLLVLNRHSPSDCRHTLEQIKILNRIPKDKEVAFIAHNGSNHWVRPQFDVTHSIPFLF